MTHHHDYMTFPLVAAVFSMTWWKPLLEGISWVAGQIGPIMVVVLLALQIAHYIRKLKGP